MNIIIVMIAALAGTIWDGQLTPDGPTSYRLYFDGLSTVENEVLRKELVKYYESESRKDWQATYSLRSNTFQETVPYDYYEKHMGDDARGWRMVSVDIIKYRSKFDEEIGSQVARITISFIDQIVDVGVISKENRLESYVTGAQFRIAEETFWFENGSGWVCLGCGTRYHMWLNSRLTRK